MRREQQGNGKCTSWLIKKTCAKVSNARVMALSLSLLFLLSGVLPSGLVMNVTAAPSPPALVSAAQDNIPPDDVANFVATTGTNPGEVDLSWTEPYNQGGLEPWIRLDWTRSVAATSFIIFESTSYGGSYVEIGTIGRVAAGCSASLLCNYIDNVGQPGDQYYYKLKAVGPTGTSGFSDPPVNEIFPGVLDHYEIKYHTSPAFSWDDGWLVSDDITPLPPDETQSMTVDNLSDGITYYFRMRAFRDAGTFKVYSTFAQTQMPDDISIIAIAFLLTKRTEGQNLPINATIINTFSTPQTVDVWFYDGNPYRDGDLIGTNTVSIPGKNAFPGIALSNIIWNTQGKSGSHSIYVKIDPMNYIDGENIENNLMGKQVSIWSKDKTSNYALDDHHDLSISQLDISFTYSDLDENTSIDISATVHNVGLSISLTFTVQFYDVYYDNKNPNIARLGMQERLICSNNVAGLVKQTSTTITYTGWGPWSLSEPSGRKIPGKHFVKVVITDVGLGKELYTNNNEAVSDAIHFNPDDSDLVIYETDISFNKWKPSPGDLVNISATPQNLGLTSVTGVIVRFYSIQYPNPPIHIGNDQTINCPALGACSQASVTWDTTGLVDTHTILVMVDPDELITEYNEYNNNASQAVVMNENWFHDDYKSGRFRFPFDEGDHGTSLLEGSKEWWYVNGHLDTDTTPSIRYGFMVCFFTGGLYLFKLTDEDQAIVYSDIQQFGDVGVTRQNGQLNITYGTNTLKTTSPFTYHLHAGGKSQGIDRIPIDLDINITANKPPMLEDGDGFIEMFQADPSESSQYSYYYSQSDLSITSGTVTLGAPDQKKQVDTGKAWIDRQWGEWPTRKGINDPLNGGWNWFSVQMDNGMELTFFDFPDTVTGSQADAGLTISHPDGSIEVVNELKMMPKGFWTSEKTGLTFTSGWILEVPAKNYYFNITPIVPEQEIATIARPTEGADYDLISTIGFWEGSCLVDANLDGIQKDGHAYVEITVVRQHFKNLLNSFSLTIQNPTQDVGDAVGKRTAVYPIQVHNFGDTQEEISLTNIIKNGNESLWNIGLFEGVGGLNPLNDNIMVASGQTMLVYLIVNAKETAPPGEDDMITVEVNGYNGFHNYSALALTTMNSYDIRVLIEQDSKFVAPVSGEYAEFVMNVTNNGRLPDVADLTQDNTEYLKWDVSFWNRLGTQELIDTNGDSPYYYPDTGLTPILPGGSRLVRARVSPESGQITSDDKYLQKFIDMFAISDGQSTQFDSKPTITIVAQGIMSISDDDSDNGLWKGAYPGHNINPGMSTTYPIHVFKTDSSLTSASLTFDNSTTGWAAELSTTNVDISGLSIGQYATIDLNVTAPLTAKAGDTATVLVTATYNTGVADTLSITSHAINKRKVILIAYNSQNDQSLDLDVNGDVCDGPCQRLMENLSMLASEGARYNNTIGVQVPGADPNFVALMTSAYTKDTGILQVVGDYNGTDPDSGLPIVKLYTHEDIHVETIFNTIKDIDPNLKTGIVSAKYWIHDMLGDDDVDLEVNGFNHPYYVREPEGYCHGPPGAMPMVCPADSQPYFTAAQAKWQPSDEWIFDAAIETVRYEDPDFLLIMNVKPDNVAHIHGSDIDVQNCTDPTSYECINPGANRTTQLWTDKKLDENTGRFFDHLKERTGIGGVTAYNESLITVTADHGHRTYYPAKTRQGLNIKDFLADKGFIEGDDVEFVMHQNPYVFIYGIKDNATRDQIERAIEENVTVIDKDGTPVNPILKVLNHDEMRDGVCDFGQCDGQPFNMYSDDMIAFNKLDLVVFTHLPFQTGLDPRTNMAFIESMDLPKYLQYFPPLSYGLTGHHAPGTAQQIPLIFHGPAFTSGCYSNERAQILDVIPTIAEINRWILDPSGWYFSDHKQAGTPLLGCMNVPSTPPRNLEISKNDTDLVLEWDTPLAADVDHYLIYRATTFDGFTYSDAQIFYNSASNLSSILNTTYTDEGMATDASNYFYVVRAVNSLGNMEFNKHRVGKYKMDLNYTGWNMISLPLVPSKSNVSKVFETFTGNYSFLEQRNAVDSVIHSTKRGITDINHTLGIWLYITQPGSMLSFGAVADSVELELVPGYNYVSYPLLSSRYVGDVLAPIDGKWSRILEYGKSDTGDYWKENATYKPPSHNNLDLMEPGKGYIIEVLEATTLPISNVEYLLKMPEEDASLSNYQPNEGDSVLVTVRIYNIDDVPSESVTVTFTVYSDVEILDTITIPSIDANSYIDITVPWIAIGGSHEIVIVADYDDNRTNGYIAEVVIPVYVNFRPVPIISYYQTLDATLKVTGKKWNSVDMFIFEDGIEISNLTITRSPDSPNEQNGTISIDFYPGRIYEVLLRYESDGGGANPIKLVLEFASGSEAIHVAFNPKNGKVQEELFNITGIIESALSSCRTFTFDGTKSFDTDGEIATYEWDFGDGTNATGKVVTHTFAAPGTYLITLTVTDDKSASDHNTVWIIMT